MIYPPNICCISSINHIIQLYKLNMYRIVVLATILCIGLASLDNIVNNICLNDDWVLQILTDPRGNTDVLNKKLHTMIPSTLHLDLLKHGIIDDPLLNHNYLELKWVSGCSVKYTKTWKVEDQQKLRGRAVELVFHGIDTYANVTLNGHHLFQANNAFQIYKIRVEKYILTSPSEQNVLEVIIQPVSSRQTKLQETNNMLHSYAHTRKPSMQYSDEENPELITMGIWKSVELIVYDEIKIDYVWVRNKLITENLAELNFAVKLHFNLFKQQKLTPGYSIQIKIEDNLLGHKAVVDQEVYINVKIANPNYWWPNGIGYPRIYDFTVLLLFNKQIIHNKTIPYGIRTAELNLENKQFQLRINGYPIYCKGANYFPMDIFQPRLTNKYFTASKSYTAEQLLQDAVDSNFNMIRIWGGGAYESEQFLQLASRKGIMIFFDFMFSNTNYPATHEFLHNVEQEIKQQIRIARNYPAVVLLNGNNQVKKKMDLANLNQSAHIQDYELIFNKLFKAVIEIQNPFIPYIHSSPLHGNNPNYFEVGGDAHIWGVQPGVLKLENYADVVSPFTTAFGIDSWPVAHTIRQFTQILAEKQIESVQKKSKKFPHYGNYVKQYFSKPKNFQAEVYFSGLLQAHVGEMAIIEQRASKPKSYGTIFWHLNDAWPSVSFSSIDYYGRWKPMQYVVKRLFSPIGIFTLANHSIFVVNDNLFDVQVSIQIWVGDFDGTSLFQEYNTLKVKANSVVEVSKVEESLINDKQRTVSLTQVYYEKILQMRTTKYFVNPKQLKLPKPKIKVSYNKKSNQLTIESQKLVKNLFIDHQTQYLHLSDNYFDVIPGFPTSVKLLRGALWKDVQDKVKFMSMRDAGTVDGKKIEEIEVVFS